MSTTRTILICSGKGGVGKTTTTANLGIALARQGAKTVVLDADFGLRNLDLLLGLENRIVYTAQEVLAETCRLEQALVKHKQEPNLALLPRATLECSSGSSPRTCRPSLLCWNASSITC